MPKLKDGTHVDDKGYLKISAGPLRGVRVHILVAEAMLGRKLDSSETVHHRDLDKKNPHHSNLRVIGRAEHGYVSTRQQWFLKQKFSHEDKAWQEWIENGGERPDGVVESSEALGLESNADADTVAVVDSPATSFNTEEFRNV